MKGNTFSLTQVKLPTALIQLPPIHDGSVSTRAGKTSRLMLSSPSNPLSGVRQSLRSHSSSPISEVQNSRKTGFKISERVAQIDLEVNERVIRLFTTNRASLLPRMMRVEKSAYVKNQLAELEQHALGLRQKYDFLRNQRDLKNEELTKAKQQLNKLVLQSEEKEVASTLKQLARKCSETEDLLGRELMYRETLEHMIFTNRRDILLAATPTQPLQKSLTHTHIRASTDLNAIMQASHETQRFKAQLFLMQQEFAKQHKAQQQTLSTLFEQYSMQKEFVTMCSEHSKQFKIRDNIEEHEEEERRAVMNLEEVQKLEGLQVTVDEQTRGVARKEAVLSQLSEVSRLKSVDDILKYWRFLEESSLTLEATRSALEDRITSLKTQLQDASKQFKIESERIAIGAVSCSTIDFIEDKVRIAEKGQDRKMRKIGWFMKAQVKMQELISDLLHRIGESKASTYEEAVTLLPRLELALVKLMEDSSPESNRTAVSTIDDPATHRS